MEIPTQTARFCANCGAAVVTPTQSSVAETPPSVVTPPESSVAETPPSVVTPPESSVADPHPIVVTPPESSIATPSFRNSGWGRWKKIFVAGAVAALVAIIVVAAITLFWYSGEWPGYLGTDPRVDVALPKTEAQAAPALVEPPKLEPVDFVDTDGTSARFDGLGIKRFSFESFELSDDFADIRALLAIRKYDGRFKCEADAGRTEFGVLVSECETEAAKSTGEHFKFMFNAGRLIELDWWAPVDNYEYVRKSLVKRYGAPTQNCYGGSQHDDKSHLVDFWCTTQRLTIDFPYRYAELENTTEGYADTKPMVHVMLTDTILFVLTMEQAKKRQQSSLEQ